MRRELLLTTVLLAGCTGIRTDLQRVEDVTHLRSADVTIDVDPTDSAEARSLLKQPLDADGAVRVALLNNRELRATLREMGIARGRLVQASVLPNPVGEVEIQPERDSAVSLRAELDVTGLVLAPLRARAAGPDVDASRFRAAGAVIETGRAARTAFLGLAASQEKLALANRALDALAAARDAAEALFRAGNTSELDFATQDAAYQTERADVAQMELDLREARETFARALALHGADVEVALRGGVESVPESFDAPPDMETRAIRASFDLQERSSRLTALARRAGLVRAEGWLPDVALDVHGLAPRNSPRDASESQWLVSAGARLTVPIFDQRRGDAAAIDATFESELERFYGRATTVRSFTRSAHARLVTMHARAKQYQAVIVPARQRVVSQAVLQYNAMQVSIFQLLAAKRDELMAELTGVDARRDYWVARATFEACLAGGGSDRVKE